MIRFIDMHRDQFGVELICRVLKDAVRGFLTSRGYRAAKSRPASARQLKDELLVGEIRRLHAENYGVYGVRKMHALLRRQGWDVGRDQTARLMRLAGVRGVKRSKKVFTTKPDPTIPQPKDLVKRNFTAPAPRRLWVADITYVATWAGFAYVAFVIDVFSRMIVGWNVASTLKADVLPLQALNMAAFNATGALDELVHHADHGSNYLSIVYTDRIVELGAKPSTGTVGDSFDNALAEAVNGLYKTELIRRQGPWRTIEQVELATLEYVWWWNNQRLHGELDYRPPVEVEDAYYADLESAQPVIAGQGTDRNETQGDSHRSTYSPRHRACQRVRAVPRACPRRPALRRVRLGVPDSPRPHSVVGTLPSTRGVRGRLSAKVPLPTTSAGNGEADRGRLVPAMTGATPADPGHAAQPATW